MRDLLKNHAVAASTSSIGTISATALHHYPGLNSQLPCSCRTIHPIRELLQVSMSRSESFVGPPYRGESAAAADGSLGRESGGLCRPDDS